MVVHALFLIIVFITADISLAAQDKEKFGSLDNSKKGHRNVDLEETIANARPFYEEGTKNGISIEKEKLQEGLELYTSLYPNQGLDITKVKTLMVAEKYLTMMGLGGNPNGSFPQGDSLIQKIGYNKNGKSEMHLTLQNQLRSKVVVDLRKKIEDSASAKSEDMLINSEERRSSNTWKPNELKIAVDVEICVVFKDGDCFVNAGEYNAATELICSPPFLSLDSARKFVLMRYVEDKLISKNNEFSQSDKESVIDRQIKIANAAKLLNESRKMGLPKFDNEKKRELYERYYSDHFAEKKTTDFDVVFSSDSCYIDSLYQLFSKHNSNKKRKQVDTIIPIDSLAPWMTFGERDIPSEVLKNSLRLKIGDVSHPQKTTIGYFIIKPKKTNFTPEKKLKDADFELIYLASREKYYRINERKDRQIQKYYTENISEFVIPDTIELLLHLMPVNAKSNKNNIVLEQIKNTRPIKVKSLDLPEDIAKEIQRQVRIRPTDSVIGPKFSRFGGWYAKILSKKISNDTVPLWRVASYIENKLLRAFPVFTLDLSLNADSREVLFNIGAAKLLGSRNILNQLASENTKLNPASIPDNSIGSTTAQPNRTKAETFNLVVVDEILSSY